MSEQSANVARFLPQSAARTPHHVAVRTPQGRDSDGRIRYLSRSFAELDRESDQAAVYLRGRGIARGMRVLLMVRPGLDLIRVTFALFKLGAVPVVIDPGMGLRSFLRCVGRTRPAALVGIPLAHAVAAVCRASFAGVGVRVMVGGGFGAKIGAVDATGFATAATRADEMAAILFTSGSTGAAKGVCYEHGMFDAQVRALREAFAIEPGEVDLPMLPVFALFNPALGMTTVVPEMNPSRPAQADPAKIVQAIEQNGVTNSFGSPVLWRHVLDHCRRAGVQLPGVRRVLMAGAPVPPDLFESLAQVLPNAALYSPYGATEALPVSVVRGDEVIGATRALTMDARGTCVGRPVAGVQVAIARLSDAAMTTFGPADRLAPGEIGEILVSGAVVTREYDAMPEATAAAKVVDADGRLWHRMGDAGYLDAEGRLWFCGRKVERVQAAGGVTHYTECVEPLFNAHPKVRRSALIGLGAPGAQTPALVVEPETGGQRPTVDELAALAARHPATAAVRQFFFEKRFPVDVRHNAKIHRLSLARKYQRRNGQ